MSLTLYFHPLSCHCQKALIALDENNTCDGAPADPFSRSSSSAG
ncbi:hypothetical protein [Bosea sp. LjRoot237]